MCNMWPRHVRGRDYLGRVMRKGDLMSIVGKANGLGLRVWKSLTSWVRFWSKITSTSILVSINTTHPNQGILHVTSLVCMIIHDKNINLFLTLFNAYEHQFNHIIHKRYISTSDISDSFNSWSETEQTVFKNTWYRIFSGHPAAKTLLNPCFTSPTVAVTPFVYPNVQQQIKNK